MRVDGIIFDADGTLLDSMPIWQQLGERYLRAQGREPEPGLREILFPMTMAESTAYLQAKYAIDKPTQQIEAEIWELVAEFYRAEVPCKPGLPAFLAALAGKGIPMAIATTGDRALLTAALTRLGLLGYFQAIFTGAELHTGKQEPTLYHAAAACLGSAPAHTLVLEDTLYALSTAAAAGYPTVCVLDDASAAQREQLCALACYTMADFTDFDGFWQFMTKEEEP